MGDGAQCVKLPILGVGSILSDRDPTWDDLNAEERLLRISDCSKSGLFTVDLHEAFNSELFANQVESEF